MKREETENDIFVRKVRQIFVIFFQKLTKKLRRLFETLPGNVTEIALKIRKSSLVDSFAFLLVNGNNARFST